MKVRRVFSDLSSVITVEHRVVFGLAVIDAPKTYGERRRDCLCEYDEETASCTSEFSVATPSLFDVQLFVLFPLLLK